MQASSAVSSGALRNVVRPAEPAAFSSHSVVTADRLVGVSTTHAGIRAAISQMRCPHSGSTTSATTSSILAMSLRAFGLAVRRHAPAQVGRTPRISCEAVPASVPAARAQGGTLSCRSGAALSFVSCIRLFGSHTAPPKSGNTSSAARATPTAERARRTTTAPRIR
jgi:hypothetical protein